MIFLIVKLFQRLARRNPGRQDQPDAAAGAAGPASAPPPGPGPGPGQ